MDTSKVQRPSVTVVLEKSARNFEKKNRAKRHKAKRLLQTKGNSYKAFSHEKKLMQKKKSPPPLPKKYNGPSLTYLV